MITSYRTSFVEDAAKFFHEEDAQRLASNGFMSVHLPMTNLWALQDCTGDYVRDLILFREHFGVARTLWDM